VIADLSRMMLGISPAFAYRLNEHFDENQADRFLIIHDETNNLWLLKISTLPLKFLKVGMFG